MKTTKLLVGASLAVLLPLNGLNQDARPAAQTAVTVFVGAHVIPMDKETVARDQTVIVRDGRIDWVGPMGKAQIPAGAVRVDAAGKFLMPALAEMHAHIPGGQAPDAAVERTLFLYVASGVTTIRGMLGDPRHLVYRERAAKGEVVSPRIYTSGPSFNGKTASNKDVAVEAVIAQKKAGYDLLKIHPGVPRDAFDALAAKADELKIPFAGHVPAAVGLQRALEAKYRSIDHLDGYVEALTKNPAAQSDFFGINLMADVDESKIPSLATATKAAGVWQVPTQVLLDNLMSNEPPNTMAARPELKYANPPGVVQKWVAIKEGYLAKYPQADREKFLTIRRKIIKALHDAGVPFALGSDAPQFWNVPGFSIHRELQSVVAAGLTPYQALKTGTVNVGVYFGTDTGTVAAGKRADLMLLDANPLEDIRNSSKIAGVVVNGRWIPRAEIDKMLNAEF
jgi:imidazolonepropionase-like amidohydrolase